MTADTKVSDRETIPLPSSAPVDIKSAPTPESKELIFKPINVPSLPIQVRNAKACVIGDFIFIAGGAYKYDTTNSLVRFDPKLNTFDMMANMLKGVNGHAVVATDNQIFVFGGEDHLHRSRIGNENQCYDMKTNTWSLKTPSPTNRAGLSATRIGDKIYISGGFNFIPIPRGIGMKIDDLKIVEVYDVKTDSWEKIADMPGTKIAHKSINIGNKLYIFGGNNATTYVYDISSKKWEQFPSLTEALPLENRSIFRLQDLDVLALGDGTILPLTVLKTGAAATAWQHRIFCFGGSIERRDSDPSEHNEVSSYLLLDQDLLNQARTALPEWSGVYRSTSSQELIINENGHVKFNDQDLFSIIFDVRTRTLYADKVGDTKDSFQSTFFISESGIKSCEGPSFTGRKEASIPSSPKPFHPASVIPTDSKNAQTSSLKVDSLSFEAKSNKGEVQFIIDDKVDCWSFHLELTKDQFTYFKGQRYTLSLQVFNDDKISVRKASDFLVNDLKTTASDIRQGYLSCRFPIKKDDKVSGGWTAQLSLLTGSSPDPFPRTFQFEIFVFGYLHELRLPRPLS